MKHEADNSSLSIDGMLTQGLQSLGLELNADQLDRLLGFHAYMLEVNATHNLTAHRDPHESLAKNLLNALGPWRQVFPTRVTADIGTGGGFPGIPLAIALEMEHLTLIESKRKKCDFLERACKLFAPKVSVECADANTVKQRFEQLVTCGFGTLEKIVRVSTRMRRNNTRVLAYKGRRQTLESEMIACPPKFQRWEIIPFCVPFLEEGTERHLCVNTGINNASPKN